MDDVVIGGVVMTREQAVSVAQGMEDFNTLVENHIKDPLRPVNNAYLLMYYLINGQMELVCYSSKPNRWVQCPLMGRTIPDKCPYFYDTAEGAD